MHKYYFDYASCTPIDDEIYKQYIRLLKRYYINSESVYSDGLELYELVETSREKIAKLLAVTPQEVFFMSGASEANSFAIKGYALKNQHRGKHIIASKMEHSSVVNTLQQLEEVFGFEVTYLDVDRSGVISLAQVQAAIRKDTMLVCLMTINNEIGSIQQMEIIGTHLKKYPQIAFMCDGVQAIGKHEFDIKDVDLFTFTTHKIFGVKGSGILIKKAKIDLLPLIHGGQQEQGLRGGTLNAPACVIAAKTLRLALESQKEHLATVSALNKTLREGIATIADVVVTSNEDCSPYILNLSCTSLGSEIMMNALNERGICVAAQSTCSSRTKTPSHTLVAMNYSDEITFGAIRISLSHLNTQTEITFLIQSLKEIIYEYRT